MNIEVKQRRIFKLNPTTRPKYLATNCSNVCYENNKIPNEFFLKMKIKNIANLTGLLAHIFPQICRELSLHAQPFLIFDLKIKVNDI